jgi:hypothetical protein
MKTLLLSLKLLLIAIAIISCQGEQGPEGPQGDTGATGAAGANGSKGDKGDQGDPGADALQPSGFISGTIVSTRRDGTPINETFKYEYAANGVQLSFKPLTEGKRGFTATRSDIDKTSSITLFVSQDENDLSDVQITGFGLEFNKALSASQLFEFTSSLRFSDLPASPLTFYYPLAPENNDDYKVEYAQMGFEKIDNVFLIEFPSGSSESFGGFYYNFFTTDGKRVIYSGTGDLIEVHDAQGNVIDAGAFAGSKYYAATPSSNFAFWDAGNNDLSGTVNYDYSSTITDYNYDSATGTLTFHYELVVPAPYTSSGNAATISGDVQVLIYQDIVYRTAAPESH